VLRGAIEIDGVPVHYGRHDEAQARGTEALVLEGTVADLALAMEEHGASQRIAGLAFVQPGMAALAQAGIRQPLRREQLRSIRPSARKARDRVLPGPAAASCAVRGVTTRFVRNRTLTG
jgi:hypothetical protein